MIFDILKGNRWLLGRLSLRDNIPLAPGQTFQLAIEGIVGKSFQGDISVDDLGYNDGPCPTTCKKRIDNELFIPL